MDDNRKTRFLASYFLRAQNAKHEFDQLLQGPIKGNEPILVSTMCLWYGLLYVVIEGWQAKKFENLKVDQLLAEKKNVEFLKLVRNDTFHFQMQDPPKRTKEAMMGGGNSLVDWVRITHSAIAEFMWNGIKSTEEVK